MFKYCEKWMEIVLKINSDNSKCPFNFVFVATRLSDQIIHILKWGTA